MTIGYDGVELRSERSGPAAAPGKNNDGSTGNPPAPTAIVFLIVSAERVNRGSGSTSGQTRQHEKIPSGVILAAKLSGKNIVIAYKLTYNRSARFVLLRYPDWHGEETTMKLGIVLHQDDISVFDELLAAESFVLVRRQGLLCEVESEAYPLLKSRLGRSVVVPTSYSMIEKVRY